MKTKSLLLVTVLAILPLQVFGREAEDALKKVSHSVVSVLVQATENSEKNPADKPNSTPPEKRTIAISGLIYDTSGHIVTSAAPFAEREKKAVIILPNGYRTEPLFIGLDIGRNIALFKLTENVGKVEPASQAEAKKVAEPVIAVGRSAEAGEIVTDGIVSVVPKNQESEVSFIQTTAAVLPQMSGGPLVDMSGNVVGVNFYIVSSSGAPVPVSFALPIYEVARVVDSLKEQEKSSEVKQK